MHSATFFVFFNQPKRVPAKTRPRRIIIDTAEEGEAQEEDDDDDDQSKPRYKSTSLRAKNGEIPTVQSRRLVGGSWSWCCRRCVLLFCLPYCCD